jgi:hypothetical protein
MTGAATMSQFLSAGLEEFSVLIPESISASFNPILAYLNFSKDDDESHAAIIKLGLLAFVSFSILWLIYSNYFVSAICLTHAEETNPICVWDDELQRVRKVPLDVLVKDRCPNLVKGVFYPTPWLFNGDVSIILFA